MSDRIMVLKEGELMGEVRMDESTGKVNGNGDWGM